MSGYSELFYQAKSNNKRIESVDKVKKEHTFYGNRMTKSSEIESNESFSIRMIAVMLILVAVMFLKQTGVFDESEVYESAMAEIHRQVTVEEIKSIIRDDAVYPVMNWMKNK